VGNKQFKDNWWYKSTGCTKWFYANCKDGYFIITTYGLGDCPVGYYRYEDKKEALQAVKEFSKDTDYYFHNKQEWLEELRRAR
jgi:hypothetical protein